MTNATVERLREQLTAARARGDRAETTRLYFALPLSERAETITAAGRGHALPPARVVGTSSAWPAARVSLPSASAAQGQSVAIMRSLRNELDDEYDGREQGGFLVGPISSDGEIFITRAIAPAYDEDRTGTSVVLDLEGAVRILETLPSDQTILGDWHSHPHESNSQPSSADIRSWERLAQFFERPWVGLIGRNAPVRVFGREKSQFEINATLTHYSNGRASHHPINLSERSY